MTDIDPNLAAALQHYRRCFGEGYSGGEYPTMKERAAGMLLRKDIVAAVQDAFQWLADVDILDVGCGPISNLGLKAPFNVHLIGVDQFGPEYLSLLAELGIPAMHHIRAGRARELWGLGLQKFHLVHSHNALDHFDDPATALAAMVSMMRPGGVLWLEFYEREGTANRWEEMHKWDFWAEANTVLATNQDGSVSLDLCRGLSGLGVKGSLYREGARILRLVGRSKP